MGQVRSDGIFDLNFFQHGHSPHLSIMITRKAGSMSFRLQLYQLMIGIFSRPVS
jgi:hypothetical protein